MRRYFRKAIEELDEDHKVGLGRVKASMAHEIEAAAGAYEHTKYV